MSTRAILVIFIAVSCGQADLTNGVEAEPSDATAETCSFANDPCPRRYDCADWFKAGARTSGVYTVKPHNNSFQVFCDMETAGGGWTVFQRRMDGSVSFGRTWQEYKQGFGDVYGEFWLGNYNLSFLTSGPLSTVKYKLRVDLQLFNGTTAFAEYTNFRVGPESSKYTLYIGEFSGTTNDGQSGLSNHAGHPFSTRDRDNDDHDISCSQYYGNSGWWFHRCFDTNLNGPYSQEEVIETYGQGLMWTPWTSFYQSIRAVDMKFRPMNFKFVNSVKNN